MIRYILTLLAIAAPLSAQIEPEQCQYWQQVQYVVITPRGPNQSADVAIGNKFRLYLTTPTTACDDCSAGITPWACNLFVYENANDPSGILGWEEFCSTSYDPAAELTAVEDLYALACPYGVPFDEKGKQIVMARCRQFQVCHPTLDQASQSVWNTIAASTPFQDGMLKGGLSGFEGGPNGSIDFPRNDINNPGRGAAGCKLLECFLGDFDGTEAGECTALSNIFDDTGSFIFDWASCWDSYDANDDGTINDDDFDGEIRGCPCNDMTFTECHSAICALRATMDSVWPTYDGPRWCNIEVECDEDVSGLCLFLAIMDMDCN